MCPTSHGHLTSCVWNPQFPSYLDYIFLGAFSHRFNVHLSRHRLSNGWSLLSTLRAPDKLFGDEKRTRVRSAGSHHRINCLVRSRRSDWNDCAPSHWLSNCLAAILAVWAQMGHIFKYWVWSQFLRS